MEHIFGKEIVKEIEIYSKGKYPEEACGFIVSGEFIPLKNMAEDRVKEFEIDRFDFLKYHDGIEAIVHSHADYPHLSKADMEGQLRTGVPWGLVCVNKGLPEHTVFWGNDVLYPLLQRPFIHGTFDCWGLCRDYWRGKGHQIIDFPRDNLWWEKDPSMLENNCQLAGFDFVDESQIQIGDVVFMKVLADVTNHCAIYIGDGLMIHHLYNRLSREEPIHRWRKYITGYLRYRYA